MPDKANKDPGTYAVRWGLGRVETDNPTHMSAAMVWWHCQTKVHLSMEKGNLLWEVPQDAMMGVGERQLFGKLFRQEEEESFATVEDDLLSLED